jgi:TetR/AcrR family transcriptional repressor of mexJK operon
LAEVGAKNAAITTAALEIFAEKGFAGASIVEIAARAGVTRRTMYARYSNKGELFAAVTAGLTDERWSLHATEEATSAEAFLYEIAADITVRSPNGKLLLRIIVSEADDLPGLDSTVRVASRDHLLDPLTETFEYLFERNLLPRADARSSATLFMDMVIGATMLNILTFAPDGGAKALLAPKVEFFCRGFAAWAASKAASK